MNDVIEKLAELLKKCPDIIRAWGCEYEDAAADLIANGVRLEEKKATSDRTSEWISVEEDKPKRRGHYFIAYRFKGFDMQFFGEAMWHDDIPDNGYVKGDHFSNEGVNGMYVTHWMEIPSLPMPPKGE